MSNNKRKTDYIILGVLGALITGVLFALVFSGWVKQDRSGMPGVRTTLSTNVDAAIVCYTLFERLSISVERSEKVLVGDVFEKIDVLFLLDSIIPIHTGEIKDIQSWLIGGGVLICTKIPKGLHPKLDKFQKRKTSSSNFSHMPKKNTRSRLSQTTLIPTERQSLPLARDILEVQFETFYTFDAATLDPNHTRGAFEPLLIDNCGIRIVMHELGHGRIIILSDSSFLANGQIGKSDNSVLAVNLVSYALSKARGNKVVFDEYHLGFGYHQTGFRVLAKMLFSTAAGWTVLSLTVAGVLYIIYKGRRFGIRRNLARKYRRSKLEYIYAVGSTYRSAGADRLTLKLIVNWLKHKVTNLTGLAQNAPNRTIAAELSRRSGVDQLKYEDIFDRCDMLIAQERLSQRQMLLIIKELARIEMEVFNEHRSRK
ncbi:MAG: hypothetical protein GY774_31010 [Planctomycetes bacterium]|nr:hypothetical protein [Planctomycetota bacterium]